MGEGFDIDKIYPVDPEDPRGLTYEVKFPDEVNIKQVTIYSRRKGVKFGGHFHKGEDSSKNPEIILVVSGRIRATLFHDGNESVETLETGGRLTIYPDTLHSLEALEDTILLEFRSTYFDPKNPDTYPCET